MRFRTGLTALVLALVVVGCSGGSAHLPTAPSAPSTVAPVPGGSTMVATATSATVSWTCLTNTADDQAAASFPGGWEIHRSPSDSCRSDEPSHFRATAASSPIFAPGPTNLRAAVAGDTVRLDWDQAPGAGGWQIEVGSGPGLSNLALFRTGAQSLFATGVPNGVYYVRVRSAPSNFSDLSAPSNEIAVNVGGACGGPPGPPSGLFLQTLTGFTVTLAWTAGSGPPPASYVVEVGSTPGASNLFVFDTGNPSTSLTATAPAGVYYVRLRGRSACGTSGPSNEIVVTVGSAPPPPPPPALNRPPTFDASSLVASAYRTARYTAVVGDPDGTVARVVISWGDNTQDTVNTGFANFSRTHVYDSPRTYTVVVFATDNLGAVSQSSRTVAIPLPPQKCVADSIVEFCARPLTFESVRVTFSAFDAQVASFTLVNATTEVPLGLGQTMTASYDFVTGRLRLRGEFCVPLLGCTGRFDETIQF